MNWIHSLSKTYISEVLNIKKPKVLLISFPKMWDINDDDLLQLRQIADVDYVQVKKMSELELAEKCTGYDYLMLNMDFLPFPDSNKMDKLTSVFYSHPSAKKLKGINVDMTDADFFSPHLARELGIPIQDSPNTTTESVAESAITEILLHARNRHLAYGDEINSNDVQCRKMIDLKGKVAGIIGYGNIGKRVAQMLNGIGMKVLVYDINKNVGTQITPIEDIFKSAKVISIHIPAHLPKNQQSQSHNTNINFINSKLLNLCNESILINLATDIIVNNEDLHKAIKNNNIIGYSVERGREITNNLKKFKNVHISPCSYDSDESRKNIKKIWIDNMISMIQGNPKNVWN